MNHDANWIIPGVVPSHLPLGAIAFNMGYNAVDIRNVLSSLSKSAHYWYQTSAKDDALYEQLWDGGPNHLYPSADDGLREVIAIHMDCYRIEFADQILAGRLKNIDDDELTQKYLDSTL